jgi:8-oxo-dGTP pyrophosphatase MutT (NUDIX family)
MDKPLEDHQELLAAELRGYRGVDGTEEAHRSVILQQVLASDLWWHRDTLPGHVTASAFVVNPALDHVLLHFHRKLDRWLQCGGHDEGERHPAKTVLREIVQETGLQSFDFLGQPAIFDLDVHGIPARGAMPAHDHLDVRFLMVAEQAQPLNPAAGESVQLQWVPLAQAATRMGDEEGAIRVVRKIQGIQSNMQASHPLSRS